MMDGIKDTPVKKKLLHEGSLMSPIYKTPRRCNIRQFGTEILSSHFTPPSGITQFIARNPFEADLTNRLHLSVISPSIFKKTTPKSHDSPFSWTIEELAAMKPVPIEEFPIQHSCSPNPEVESKAQEAIFQFFSQEKIHPSPWDRQPVKPLLSSSISRSRLIDSNESQKSTRTCGVQTTLSLPPKLPKHIEDILKPYFTGPQEFDDVDCSNISNNSSNNSLRRKLFTDDSFDDESDDDASEIIPYTGNSSPPQSGMLMHGTPIGRYAEVTQRTHGTPYLHVDNLSPPDMSPIYNNSNETPYEGDRQRSLSTVKLNLSAAFSPMSVDKSLLEAKEADNLLNDGAMKTKPSMDKNPKEPTNLQEEKFAINETIEMESILQDLTPIKCSRKEVNKHLEDLKEELFSDRGPENNTMIGYSEFSAFNSVQDTGYQTYSMNSTTNVSNKSSLLSVQKSLNWNERPINSIFVNGDEYKLSDWQKNIKDVRSSTPSKYHFL